MADDGSGDRPSLSFNAEIMVGALQGRLGPHPGARDWFMALLDLDRARARAVAGQGLSDLEDTVRQALARGDRGTVLEPADIQQLAGHEAARDERKVASNDDVAAAIVAAVTTALAAPAGTTIDRETPEPADPISVTAAAGPPPRDPADSPGADQEVLGAAASRVLPGAGRTFRLFVSSTFADLQEERNALHRKVLPELAAECARYGARFQAIDLRWGVSTEAGLDQKTMPLCLAEIERCQRTDRPNFLVLLGDRYGWRPLPATIPAEEFASITQQLTAAERGRFEEWYRRDANAVPEEYYLKPRAKEGPYGVSADGEAAWQLVESDLGDALRRVVPGLGLPDTAAAKYLTSATEQEIVQGALAVDDAADHVFCFVRTIPDLPHDASSARFEDISDGQRDEAAAAKLADLKARLEAHVPGNIIEYPANWVPGTVGGVTPDHLTDMCRDVGARLLAAIRQRFADDAGRSAFEAEIEAHDDFGRERAGVFIGRQGPLDAIAAHIAHPTGRLLAVHGDSGSGKSALMAKAASAARHDPIVKFIGATARSTERRSLLADLCRQIGDRYGDTTEIPADFRELTSEFIRRLGLATPDRPLVLFFDGLDQLDAPGSSGAVTWLPAALPDHVAIVVSTLPGETLGELEAKQAEPVAVEPMPREEADDLLGVWLAAVGRRLQPGQAAEVMAGFERNGLPLYLKLAFEEARLWRSDGDHYPLAADVPGLIHDNLFNRLDDPEHHGEVLVARTLGYLSAARFGLAEDELLRVLAADDAVMEWVEAESSRTGQQLPAVSGADRQLPVVLWSRLHADLEPYLAERAVEGATVLTFYHRQFDEVSERTYLADERGRDRHASLARYFRRRVDPVGDGSWTGPDRRGLSELPYHLTEAGDWEGVEEVLTDFRFLERKVSEIGIVDRVDAAGHRARRYTGVYQLRDDYDHALARMELAGGDPRHRIVVTGLDLGDGLEVRCPHCDRMIPWREDYRGQEISCPLEGCGGPLHVNPFVVGDTI